MLSSKNLAILRRVELVYMQYNISESGSVLMFFFIVLRMASLSTDTLFLCPVGQQVGLCC